MRARSLFDWTRSAGFMATPGATARSQSSGPSMGAAVQRSLGVAGLMALAALVSHIITLLDVTPRLQREGACIAMDMAMAYGALDEPKRKIISRAISETRNPYAGRFTGGYRELNEACETIARNRWHSR